MITTMAVGTGLWLIGAGMMPPAQAAGGDAPPDPARLQLEVVVSRYRGDERVASLPYSLRLTAEGRETPAQLRAGVEVPVEVTAGSGRARGAGVAEIQYRSVGTNIDCWAAAARGSYAVWLSVEHSLVLPAAEAESPSDGAPPMFSTFFLSSQVALSDGESVELVSSTDPATGEVMRVRLTLRVD